jgi:hypothetical protein
VETNGQSNGYTLCLIDHDNHNLNNGQKAAIQYLGTGHNQSSLPGESVNMANQDAESPFD